MKRIIRINTPRIAHQTIAGETIIIDIVNGTYFSLNQTASVIWELIQLQLTEDAIIQELNAQYEATNTDIQAMTENLLSELATHELIIMQDLQTNTTNTETYIPQTKNLLRKTFEPPRIQIFTDMQDLLLLDPIHDVDDQGWPAKSNDDDK